MMMQKKIYPKQYAKNPELMTCPTDRKETISAFHYEYLRLMLSEKNIRYTKKRPKDTLKPYYINAQKRRLSQTPDHLYTLNCFFNFCNEINKRFVKQVKISDFYQMRDFR